MPCPPLDCVVELGQSLTPTTYVVPRWPLHPPSSPPKNSGPAVPHDRWSEVLTKVGEYLAAGVQVVCVLDPELKNTIVCRADPQPRVLATEADLELPEVHAEFRGQAARFFG